MSLTVTIQHSSTVPSPHRFILAQDIDLYDLAMRCPANVTGADIYALCSEALLAALRQLVQQLEREGRREDDATLIVSADHFNSALSHLTPSVSQTELERYQKLQKR